MAHAIVRGLGYLSLGLAALELLAPDKVGRYSGVGNRRALVRAFGVRELLAGAGMFVPGLRKAALWSRVLGDVIDLGTLGSGLSNRRERSRTLGAMAAVAGVLALDAYMAKNYSLWA